jgi:hypothetical protein
MYPIYNDDLFKELEDSGLGCYIGNEFFGILGYADDIVLLSPNKSDLLGMVDICLNFASRYHINFNSGKSQLAVFGNCDIVNDCIRFLNVLLKPCKFVKYLGFNIDVVHCKIDIVPIVKDMFAKSITVTNMFKHIHGAAKFNLFRTFAYSLYGCTLWSFSDAEFIKLQTCWRKCVRQLFGLHYRTHNSLLPFVCDSVPIEYVVFKRFVKFLQKSLSNENHKVSFIANLLLSGSGSIANENLLLILNVLRLNAVELLDTLTESKLEKLLLHKFIDHVTNFFGTYDKNCLVLLLETIYLRDNFNVDFRLLNRAEIVKLIEFLCTC